MSSKGAPIKGKDLEAYRAAHDRAYIIPRKIKAGLADLGDSWEYEADFIRRCGLSQVDFAQYRDQFAEFFVETRAGSSSRGKRVWAGTKAFAARIREIDA